MSQFGTVMSQILESLQQRLIEDGRPCERVSLYPGTQEVWDMGSAKGQLYLRHVQTFPTTNFPYQQFQPVGNAVYTPNAVRLAAGILRCGSTIDDNGNPPTPEQINADALDEADDTIALIRFFYNDLRNIEGIKAQHFASVDPKPAAGMMHGVEMTFYLLLDAC